MKIAVKVLALFLFLTAFLYSQESAFDGKWEIIKEKSTDIDSYSGMGLEFTVKGNELTIITRYIGRLPFEEKMVLKTNGSIQKVEVKSRAFPTNTFMAMKNQIGNKKEVSAKWENNILKINEKYEVISSQASKVLNVLHTYELSSDKHLLTYQISRDSRAGETGIKYVLKKADFNNAYVMKMSDNWEIDGKLPEQACLISLQALANENKPNLYFVYGEQWAFNYTPELFNFLKDQRYFSFTQLNSLDQALNTFKEHVKGYIVWDKKERTSLIVAYTLAGLERGIVISEELLPLMQKYGFKQIEDFRGKFSGKSDYEIYSWAKDKYWSRCSKDIIIWMGGEFQNVMKPGIADFGMNKKAFFSDLSGRESDTLEYGLTNKLLSEMNPLGLMMGWHSYKKDLEEEFTTLASKYAITTEGLNTLPNMSFMSQIPASPGFKFTNNHNIEPGKKYTPEKKVYITFIQTDGLGLGAWVKPGRGTLHYAWEVSMTFYWLAPAQLEYFYSQKTPADYFLGCLSGSAYMYPKAYPKKWLPEEIKKAKKLMDNLDLQVFEIMDYSDNKMIEGTNNLPKEIVDAYYDGMPGAIGFLNGYRPSYTNTVKDKVPFISYDYYLSPRRPVMDAVGDLHELAKVNSIRPYFLLVHVRESSDIVRVKSIADKLGPEFEVVPLDIFLKMAGENPTFKERFMDESELPKK
jgi:hypothetical protein